MNVETIADLAKIADLCRKKGIESIKITQDAVEFKLGDKPSIQRRNKKGDDKDLPVMTGTPEDVLFWSTPGVN